MKSPIFNRYLLFGGDYDGDLRSKVDSLSLRPPLRKLFVEDRDGYSSSAWNRTSLKASPELCKKSNSTGFSKLWRFRDLVHRSNSDGKERGLALCGISF